MTAYNDYQRRRTWKYPEPLILLAKSKIEGFFKDLDHGFENFSHQNTYEPLANYIQEKTEVKVTKRWLKDFFTNQKDHAELKKKYFEAVLRAFNLDFQAGADHTRSKNYAEKDIEVDEDVTGKKLEILRLINSSIRKNKKVAAEFVGKYKYFLGARKDSIYDYIYENEMEILPDGAVKIYNPFSKQHYTGIIFTRNEKTLQILSFDFSEGMIEGVGNLITLRVNLYGKKAKLIPGTSLSFDADLNPIASQVLLSVDLTFSKTSKIIRSYFDDLATQLRLYCPSTEDVAAMVRKQHKT